MHYPGLPAPLPQTDERWRDKLAREYWAIDDQFARWTGYAAQGCALVTGTFLALGFTVLPDALSGAALVGILAVGLTALSIVFTVQAGNSWREGHQP